MAFYKGFIPFFVRLGPHTVVVSFDYLHKPFKLFSLILLDIGSLRAALQICQQNWAPINCFSMVHICISTTLVKLNNTFLEQNSL